MNRRRHLAGGATHAAVGHQRYLETPALQHRQRWRQLVQFWHAVGLRALPAHHTNQIPIQFIGLKGAVQSLLRIKDPTRRFNQMPLQRHGRDLDHAATQVAAQQFEATGGAKRCRGAAQHAVVPASANAQPMQGAGAVAGRLTGVFAQTAGSHGQHISMHQTGVQQFPNHEARTTCCLKLVDVSTAVGIDARQQGHCF